ncbi:MAG: hypothetical protein ABSA47_17880 [Verrucomicrobiota bacterium]|jgi:hypothetical protein
MLQSEAVSQLGRRKGPGLWLALGFLGLAAALIFARLGHYPLWDDEAGTALGAKGVLRAGDTSALVDDHNILAYRGGSELVNLRVRYVPPLQVYLTAPFLAVFGEDSALAARLPFALCGLAVLALIVWWLWRANAGGTFALLLCLGLVCNVSLILYSRQCRYYSAGMLCCVAVAYLYLNWKGQRGWLPAIGLISFCLLALNYLYYLAFYVCLAADYAFWRRREKRLGARDWLALLLPQLVLGAVVIWIWNPFSRQVVGEDTVPWLQGKLTLFWWNWRDLDRCEFGSLLVLGMAPLLYRRSGNPWLIRAPLALFIFVSVMTLCAPHPMSRTTVADVRYLAPAIPLCVAVEALTLCALAGGRRWAAVALGAVVFGTNLGNGGPALWCGFRSTIASYVGEIFHPPSDPYTETAQWINGHVRENESIWVRPEHACYPLMFHAPKATYAWQLAGPPTGQFAGLPPIHFFGETPPDYIIVFGPEVRAMTRRLYEWRGQGVHYGAILTIHHYWDQRYRPELFWHVFSESNFPSEQDNAIYVFRHLAEEDSDRSNWKPREFP